MTPKEASRILRISVRVVRKLCHEKKIDAEKALNNALGIDVWQIHQLPFEYRILTTKGLAAVLGVSDRWVRKLCKDGRVKACRIGHKWHIDSQDGAKLIAIRSQS